MANWLVSLVISVLVRGLAITQLWRWFMVSTFHLPALSIPQALGLGVLVSYMTFQPDSEHLKQSVWYQAVFAVILSLFVLAMGWIYSLLM